MYAKQESSFVFLHFYTVFLHFKTLYLDLNFAKEIYLKVFTTEDKIQDLNTKK